MMTSLRGHVALITVLVFFKRSYVVHVHTKFHSVGLTASGFMRGPFKKQAC